MNLLSHPYETREDEHPSISGRIKKLGNTACFFGVGVCGALVVLGIVVAMRFAGRDLIRSS